MRAIEVLEFVSSCIGVSTNNIPDGGFIHGKESDVVHGILVTWMATLESIEYAVEKVLNLMICHEDPFFEETGQAQMYRWTTPDDEKAYEKPDHPNQKFKGALEESGSKLTLLQIHYGLDRLCIFDEFTNFLELGKPLVNAGYESVYTLPSPMNVRELAEKVASKLNLASIRVIGDLNRKVQYSGNLWGGVGLSSNRYWMRKQIENGADVLICGETDEIAMMFALAYDVPLIVTSHVLSENIGLKIFVDILQKQFCNLPIGFFEIPVPFYDMSVVQK